MPRNQPFDSMKRLLSFCCFVPALWLLLGLLPAARAATTNLVPATSKTNMAGAHSSTNSATSGTNAAPVELPIPSAMFDVTNKPTHDPFFPLSLRQPVPDATNAAPAFSAAAFTLKGLSGAAGSRLALINNRTIAPGENAEITTPSGKIKVYCVEIKESSVVIRAESQADPVEIFLRKNAQ